MRTRLLGICLLSPALVGACGETMGSDTPPIPPPGPHFRVLPIPFDKIARITPIGYNNKIIPTPHTYWITCDSFYVLPSSRPCIHEKLPIAAPADGTIYGVLAAADGTVSVEGPPGLIWTLGHVTPAAGLARGSRVTAGQIVATMFYTHGFDFGVENRRVNHRFIVPDRYGGTMLHGEHPAAQFAEPLRSQLLGRATSLSDPLGRIAFDSVGTSSGYWVMAGKGSMHAEVQNWPNFLVLSRWIERQDTRILSLGTTWPGMSLGIVYAVDPAAPAWEDITAALGAVTLKLFAVGVDARPNLQTPSGSLLVQVRADNSLRIEWFNTQGPVAGFTAAARTYVR